jgi:hypothetical protein
MHNHRKDSIAGAIVVVNSSAEYENPDAFAKGLKRPRFNMDKVVADTVGIFRAIPLRNDPGDPNDQPEALAIIVVDYDGVHPAHLVTTTPAPREDEPTHYDSFLHRICNLYRQRFSGR